MCLARKTWNRKKDLCMNAIELAYKLELACHELADDAAAMLRYQENQIQTLKMQLAYLETKVYGGSTK